MRVAEVAGLEGVAGEVSGLILLWKFVEKSKYYTQKTRVGTLDQTAISTVERGENMAVVSSPNSQIAWIVGNDEKSSIHRKFSVSQQEIINVLFVVSICLYDAIKGCIYPIKAS